MFITSSTDNTIPREADDSGVADMREVSIKDVKASVLLCMHANQAHCDSLYWQQQAQWQLCVMEPSNQLNCCHLCGVSAPPLWLSDDPAVASIAVLIPGRSLIKQRLHNGLVIDERQRLHKSSISVLHTAWDVNWASDPCSSDNLGV